eukprot:1932307-Ditylum_brightwellii.AAC.1
MSQVDTKWIERLRSRATKKTRSFVFFVQNQQAGEQSPQTISLENTSKGITYVSGRSKKEKEG